MRTILVAGGYPHQLPGGVVRAFAAAGWRAEFFDLSPESPFHQPFVKPVRKIIHTLRIQRHPETFDSTFLSNLGWRSDRWLRRLRALRPDAALILRGNRIALPQLQAASATGVPLFCWMLENESRLPGFLHEAQAGVYRKIFVYAQSYMGALEQAGSHGIYYPHRAPALPDEARVVSRDRKYDWSFLGSYSPWREKVLTAILNEFPNGKLVGPHWLRLWRREARFRKVVGYGYYTGKKATALYLDSRIGLDICAQEKPGTSGVAMRVPELIACGCRVLLQEMTELRALPYPEASFTAWRTIDELLELMRRELSEPPPPEIALAAARSVVGYENLVGQVTAAL